MNSDFRKVITASACAFNIGMLSWWAQPIIVHSVIKGLSLSESHAGLVISAEIMAIALTSFTLAPRIDRLPIRKICFLASLGAIACHFLSIYTGIYSVLLFVRASAGIAEGMVYAIAVGVVASTVNPDRGYGVINAVNIIYCSIFMALVPSIDMTPLHSVTFASLAIASLILLPFIRFLPVSMSAAVKDRPLPAPSFDSRTWLLLLAMFLWGTGINTLWPYLFYIGTNTSLDAEQVGIALGSCGFTAFAGVILMIVVGNRFGHLRPLMVGLTINLIAVLMITMAGSSGSYVVGLMTLMLAVYYLLPLILAISAENDPTGRIAAATGGMYMFTGGIGPVIGGVLVSELGAKGIGIVFIAECMLSMYLLRRVTDSRHMMQASVTVAN